MFLFAKTFCSNPDVEDGTVAVVELTKELLESILKRKKIFEQAVKKDKSLFEMYFWDGSCDWYSNDALDIGEKDFMFSKELGKITAEVARTECDQMIIRKTGVAWIMIPKHSNVFVTTSEMEFELIGLKRNPA